jgi:hypothetical protein
MEQVMVRTKLSRLFLLTIPLAVLPALLACDSATGPKFPDPIEEEEDTTIEEGMQRRWSMVPEAEIRTGAMPFTYPVPETT